MNRVVITGIGSVLPCGDIVEDAFNNVINCNSWTEENKKFDNSTYRSKVCAPIYLNDNIYNKYDFLISKKDIKKYDNFEYIAMIASYNALKDSNLLNNKNFDKNTFGTFITSGIGGAKTFQDEVKILIEKGNKKISPFFIPSILINMVAGNIAIKFGLNGSSMSHVSACASSANAIGEAFNKIRNGELNGCLAGGSEMGVVDVIFAGFDNIKSLSSKYNDNPKKASRPLDKDRNGFVMGEGSVILVLENLEHAKKRNAKIYCEIVGYGSSCDAYHITSPDPDGKSVSLAIMNAVKNANIEKKDIDYINLHATSTQNGDLAEINAIKKTFNECYKNIAISSTKSITGHLMGAAGALEAMLCAKSLEQQILLPSANIENLDENFSDMNIITTSKKTNINYIMSNSFGFGGTNACLIFKKYEE